MLKPVGIAAALLIVSSCSTQHGRLGTLVQIPTKPRAVYVAVSKFETATIVAEPPLAELDAVLRGLPAGNYVLSISALDSYGVSQISLPLTGNVEVGTTNVCVKIDGVIDGDAPARRIAFYPWERPRDAIIVPVDERGHFDACIPQDRYAVSVMDNEVVSAALTVDVLDPRTSIHVAAWLKSDLDSGLPPDAKPQPRTIQELAGAIPATARIVGIGESDHGSRTALTVRGRMLAALAARDRLSAVALEVGAVEAFAIDDYVQGRVVDIRKVVASNGYWIWDTEEFISFLVSWRAYNAAHRDAPVHMIGVDQPQTAQAVDYLVAGAERLGIDDETLELLRPLREKRAAAVEQMSPTSVARVMAALEAVIGRGAVDSFDTQSSRDVVAAASVRNRIVASQKKGLHKTAQRDRAIAEMLLMYADVDRGRAVAFLGHNQHVMNLPDRSPPPAGAHLRHMVGDEYFAIGLLALDGETRAWDADLAIGVIPQRLEPSPASSFGGAFAAGSAADTMCILNGQLTPAAHEWLRIPRAVRGFGPTFVSGDDAYEYLFMDLAVDAAILMRNVQPTTPTATGVRRQTPGG